VVPQDLRHTREREWAQVTAPGTVRVGQVRLGLGDRVLVGLPVAGARVAAGRTVGGVETIEGGREPELINSDAGRGRADLARAHGKRAASDYTEYTEQG